MKKAFSMFEIIASIIIMTLISYYALMQYMRYQREKAINVFLNKVDAVISKAVTDPSVGYVNGTGGYCSSNSSYTDLTLKRALNCIGWENNFAIGGTDPASYAYKLLPFDSVNANGCKIYLREPLSTDTNNIFYMYIDCSNYDGNKQYIEERISANIKANFPTIIQDIDYKATGIDYSSSATSAFYDKGDESDGKIGFKFKD